MAWKFLCSVHLGWKGGCSQAEAVLDFRAVVSAGPNLTSGCSLQGSLGTPTRSGGPLVASSPSTARRGSMRWGVLRPAPGSVSLPDASPYVGYLCKQRATISVSSELARHKAQTRGTRLVLTRAGLYGRGEAHSDGSCPWGPHQVEGAAP
jgi:hypothetical protein